MEAVIPLAGAGEDHAFTHRPGGLQGGGNRARHRDRMSLSHLGCVHSERASMNIRVRPREALGFGSL